MNPPFVDDRMRRLGWRFVTALLVLFVSFSLMILAGLATIGIDRLIGEAYYLLDFALLGFAGFTIAMVIMTWAALGSDSITDWVWRVAQRNRIAISILGGTGVVFYTIVIICLIVYGPSAGAR